MTIKIENERNDGLFPTVEMWVCHMTHPELFEGDDPTCSPNYPCDFCEQQILEYNALWIVPETNIDDKTDYFIHPVCFHDFITQYMESVTEKSRVNN